MGVLHRTPVCHQPEYAAPLKCTHLKLSDAFIGSTDKPNLELLVEVLDINHDRLKNTKLEKCRPLYEYSYLIDKIRNSHGPKQGRVNVIFYCV